MANDPGISVGNANPSIMSFGTPTDQRGQKVMLRLVDNTQGLAQENTIVFDINPEDIVLQEPSRVTTVNTIAGAYQDNWGPGIGRLQLSGNTGWRKKTSDDQARDGFQLFKALDFIHKQYQSLCAENDPSNVVLLLLLPPGPFASFDQAQAAAFQLGIERTQTVGAIGPPSEPTQFAFLRVSSDNFVPQRSKSQSLLFRYQWDMTILEDYLRTSNVDPSKRFVVLGGGSSGDPLRDGGTGGTGDGGGSSGGKDKGGSGSKDKGSGTKSRFTADQIKAARAATEAMPIGSPQPEHITAVAGQTLAEVGASIGVTAEEFQLYAFSYGLPIPDESAPFTTRTTLIIPPSKWINIFQQTVKKP